MTSGVEMTPDIDLDALTALIKAADLPSPIEMDYRYDWEAECVVGIMTAGDGVEARIHTEETARLIEAALNNLPALLSALTATRAELAEQRSRNLTYLANQGALNQRLTAELTAANAVLKAIDEHVTGMWSEIGDHQDHDYDVTDHDETRQAGHTAGRDAEHERITYDLRALLDNDAVRMATGVTCQPGQPWSCGDAHTAGHCVRPQAAPVAAPQPDEMYDPIAVLDEAIAASGMRITFDPRHIIAPHTHRGPKASDPDREHPAHDGKTCEEYEAAGAGDSEQDTATIRTALGDDWSQLLNDDAPASVQGAADGEAQA